MNLAVTFTRRRGNQPLLVLDNAPVNGLAISPADLRRLGQMLVWLADLGEALPTEGLNWRATHVDVDMESMQGSTVPTDATEVAYWAAQFINNFAKPFNAASVPVIPLAQIEAAREKRSAGQPARQAQRQKGAL